MCRHTLASIGAFFTFDNLAEIVKSYLRSANVNKCSHNGSYHIPASVTLQSVVLTSEWLLQNAPKSLVLSNIAAASFILLKSRS